MAGHELLIGEASDEGLVFAVGQDAAALFT